MADKGVSGYHGRNHRKGALGRLLKQIKPGQVLLIEDCDRWSREDPIEALSRLKNEVRKGIEVVFLRTGTRVTADNFSDISVLVPNFFGALLGNGESVKKAERIKATWDRKKELARQGKAVRINRLPCWLEWDTEQEKPRVNETKAAVVRRLYALAGEGQGVLEICRAMAGTPPLSIPKKKNPKFKPTWNPRTVRRILTDQSVLGYCTCVEPPAAGVWPAIIDEKVYALAQSKLDIQAGDKRPGHVSERNLFTNIIKCGRCGEHHLNCHRSGGKRGYGEEQSRLVCTLRIPSRQHSGNAHRRSHRQFSAAYGRAHLGLCTGQISVANPDSLANAKVDSNS